MLETLLFILVIVPILAALAIFLLRESHIRSLIVVLTGAALAAASIALCSSAGFTYMSGTFFWISHDTYIMIADFFLLFVIMFYAVKLRSTLIQVLTVIQILFLAYFEFFMVGHGEATPAFYGDQLSIIMVLIISIVGSLICIFGIPYMKKHEDHLHLERSKQPQFFFYMVLFLGAMNGLVLANNILWLYFFFEVTTFCSFMLIGHDQTEIAIANSKRALWMNSLGGVAFLFGMMWLYADTQTLGIQEAILAAKANPATQFAVIAPLALLCFAGFTKAAQVPFQSWLLGAMVAPTPVSALLHSSTMVKAGVYVCLRFSPAYSGTFLSYAIALCGGFTFLVAAALAIGQSNGKKILAYSTISNLGLIIACAGINTSAAITAAIMLIIFHAISKALLFLCVGTIEQKIGSRDVEDMRGLYGRMPKTTVLTIIGILTMLLPPFGALMSKWMAIEAASVFMVPVIMLAVGSALTLVFWARWAGILLSIPFGVQTEREDQAILTAIPLRLLACGAIVLSLFSPWIYTGFIAPLFGPVVPYMADLGILFSPVGGFAVFPLFVVASVGALYVFYTAKKSRNIKRSEPYMCGAQIEDPDGSVVSFKGPMNQPVVLAASNYYLTELFGEEKLTLGVNIVAGALIALMIGGAL